jgi:hypothetical protein|tara:strand:+ start:1816 stop:2577 length:762 start_codon:yes stop_codon:yes gene_type:complete
MKVALLLSGQPKYLDDPRPYYFFKENIIDRYDTDVYCQTWFEEGAEYEITWIHAPNLNTHRLDSSTTLSVQSPVLDNSDKIIKGIYKPKKYSFEPPRHFRFNKTAEKWLDERYTGKHVNGVFWDRHKYSCILSFFKSQQNVLSLVDKDDYDFFVLSRYDITIDNFSSVIDISTLDPEMMHLQNIHDSFPDGIYIFSKKYFDWFKNLYDEIQTLDILEMVPHPSPERLKKASFGLHYGMNSVQPHPIRINILRV